MLECQLSLLPDSELSALKSKTKEPNYSISAPLQRTSRNRFKFYYTYCVPIYNYDDVLESLEVEGYAGA